MSTALAAATCHHHPSRPAAAKCRRCGHFICRECVTDHAGVMTCGACLRELEAPVAEPKRWRLGWLREVAAAAVGFVLLVLAFAFLGLALSRLPDSFDPRRAQDEFLQTRPSP